jgi:formate dehydrogenase iron-sulfur subunit
MLACPFHIPRYQWSQTIPFVQKCDFCYEKIHQGERPACADICPNDAIYFGEREDVLNTARLRIQRDPDRYLPKIWGETEFGGTSMLYISDVPLEKLGWPHNVTSPIPEITDPLISLTPQIGLSVFTGSFALKWIIDRRNRLQHAGTNPKKH